MLNIKLLVGVPQDVTASTLYKIRLKIVIYLQNPAWCLVFRSLLSR